MYGVLLFDLDGTLTDSERGILNSVSYALEKYGIEYTDREALRCFIGPPLIEMFRKKFDVSEDVARELVRLYREYFSTRGLYENDIYDGIKDLLAELKSMGKRLIVATSKPEHFATKILEHFELSEYFEVIAGATMDETRTAKADVIKYALDTCKISDTNDAVMIGDREYDILGARKFQMDSIGVLYGYGSLEELTNAGATYIAESVSDILKFI